MRIARIDTFIPRIALGAQTFYSSQAPFPQRNSLLVRLETTDGAIGWGEGGQYGPPTPVATCIHDVLTPLLTELGEAHPVSAWERMYAATRDFGQSGSYIEAISAIDNAMWDAYGRELGRPVHQLLGGSFRDRVLAYATGGYYSAVTDSPAQRDALARQFTGFFEAGFTAAKMKVGLLPLPADAQRVRLVRDAIGDAPELMVDANHAYNLAAALQLGGVLEECRIGWFEEPVVPEDLAGYRALSERLRVPIAGGEAHFTRYGFDRFISEGRPAIIQPDISCCGGLSEFTKILALATARGVRVVPHVWGSAVALATALQAIAIIPPIPYTFVAHPLQNDPAVEYDQSPNPLRTEISDQRFELEAGCLPIPDRPGLGIGVDEDAVRALCAS